MLAGCAGGSGGEGAGPNTTSVEARRGFAARPGTVEAGPSPSTSTSTADEGSASPNAPGAATADGGQAPAPAPVVRLRLDDAGGDAESRAPALADLRSVEVVDEGEHLRVTVTVAGQLPSRFRARETLGIGVDLFKSETPESDYQLFADGGADGWFAYLQTPKGLVVYPGSFGVDGTRVVFRVRWSDVGGLRSGRASAFVDWSYGTTESSDGAPEDGTRPY